MRMLKLLLNSKKLISKQKLMLLRLKLRNCNKTKLLFSNRCKLSHRKNNLRSNNYNNNSCKLKLKVAHKMHKFNNYRPNFRLNSKRWNKKSKNYKCNSTKLNNNKLCIKIQMLEVISTHMLKWHQWVTWVAMVNHQWVECQEWAEWEHRWEAILHNNQAMVNHQWVELQDMANHQWAEVTLHNSQDTVNHQWEVVILLNNQDMVNHQWEEAILHSNQGMANHQWEEATHHNNQDTANHQWVEDIHHSNQVSHLNNSTLNQEVTMHNINNNSKWVDINNTTNEQKLFACEMKRLQ